MERKLLGILEIICISDSVNKNSGKIGNYCSSYMSYKILVSLMLTNIL